MKKLVLMLAIAGMAFTACNKKNTPPEETAAAETTTELTPDEEELRRQKMAAMEERQRQQAERKEQTEAFVEKREADKEAAQKMGYIKCSVVDESQNGDCGFLLRLYNGNKMKPTNLPDLYKSHGKTLWVKFMPTQETFTCKVGKVVRLIDVTPNKPAGE